VDKQAAPPAAAPAGVAGGVPSGIAGGAPGGVIGGIVGNVPSAAPPPPPQAQNARALYYAEAEPVRDFRTRAMATVTSSTGRPPMGAHLGVRYSFFRTQSDGERVEVLPSELKQGDSVSLRFIANEAGTLRVTSGADIVVASAALGRLNSFTTPAFAVEGQEITVTFDRQSGAASNAMSAARQTEPGEKSTYVVNTTPGAGRLLFTISLK
jgi:hypothetical protein